MIGRQPKLILVPTDFSETAGHAMRYASSLARRSGAHLIVLFSDVSHPPIARAEQLDETREELIRHAESNIAAAVPFDLRIATGSPVDAILNAAADTGAELIIMGTHGRTGLHRLIVGSVTERVMSASAIPVIAVKSSSNEQAHIRRILCPITYTDATVAALEAAAALVNERNAPIILLQSDDGLGADGLMRLQAWLPADLVDRCELKFVPQASAAAGVLEMERVAYPDLIVMGTTPDRSLAEMIRGTVAERVVEHSACPVLTVSMMRGVSSDPIRSGSSRPSARV